MFQKKKRKNSDFFPLCCDFNVQRNQNELEHKINRNEESGSIYRIASVLQCYKQQMVFAMKSANNSTTNQQIDDGENVHRTVLKRWINAQIKSIGKAIDNLHEDLSDGSVLIELLQKLSMKKVRKFAEDAQSKEDKLANVRIVFLFLKAEHVPLEIICMLLVQCYRL